MPERRRRYDVFGEDGTRPSGGGASAGDAFGFGDIFDAFFGGDPFGRRSPGLDPFRWTLPMRTESRENVRDDSASETLLHARVQGTHR